MDNLRFDIEWNANEDELRAAMDASKKSIEGVGQSVEVMEKKVAGNISQLMNSSENQIAKLQQRIKSLEADLARWTNPKRSSLGLKMDDPALDKYKAEILALRSKIDEINAKTIEPKVNTDGVKKVNAEVSDVLGQISSIGAGLGIAFSADQLLQFGKGLFNIAKEAEGVELAFAKIGDPAALDRLTKATKGTVNELTLMKMAVQADDFRIPMDVLAKGLEFANKKAGDTGQSVDYLVNSFVTGLGRQSTQILDNLGISAHELNKEVEKTGDFMLAVSNIMDKQLAGGGDVLDMLANKTDRWSARIDNLQKKLSDAMRAFFYTGAGGASPKGIEQEVSRLNTVYDGFEKFSEDNRKTTISHVERLLSNERKTVAELKNKIEEEVKKFYPGGDEAYTRSLSQQYGLDKVLEKTTALSAVLERMKKTNDSINTSARQGKGVFSQNELEAKLESYTSLLGESVDPKEQAKYREEIKRLKKQIGEITGDAAQGKATRKMNAELDKSESERISIIAKWASVDADYQAKTLDKDEQEVEAVKRKYAEIKKTIEDFNKTTKGQKISTSGLDESEQASVKVVTDRQDNDKLIKSFEDEYKVFLAYEKLKKETSAEYANKRYEEQLDSISTFEERLQAEIVGAKTGEQDGLEKKRYEALAKIRQDWTSKEQAEEKKKYAKLLETLITYDQERKNKIAEFEKTKAQLLADGRLSEAKVLEEQHREGLGKLDDANIEKLDSVKELFKGIEDMTDAGARTLIDKIKALLSSDTNMSSAMRADIEKALGEATEALDDRLPERVMVMSDAFGDMAQEVGRVNEGLGSMLQGVSDVLRVTVQINDGFDKLTKGLNDHKAWKEGGKKGGLLGGISSIAGIAGPVGQIVGAVSGVVSGVVGFFKASKESARRAAAEMKAYTESVIAGELEYNRILRERAREHQNINDLTAEQIKQQQELLKLQKAQATTEFDALLKRVQGGEQITGQETSKSGGFLGIGKKTSVVDITAGLSGYTYEQLEELYTSKKLTAATAALFEELRKAKEEVDGIAESWDDMQNKLLDRMSGGATADAMTSGILRGLKDGKRAFEDFGGDVTEIIENALLAGLAADVLDGPIKELVKKFRDDAKDGLDPQEIESFKQAYEGIVKSGLDAIKDIEKMTGKAIGGDGDSGSPMANRIKSITTEQADVVAGQLGAIHLLLVRDGEDGKRAMEVALQHSDLLRNAILYYIKIEENTKRTANNTDKLHDIERHLYDIKGKTSNQLRAGGNK